MESLQIVASIKLPFKFDTVDIYIREQKQDANIVLNNPFAFALATSLSLSLSLSPHLPPFLFAK